MYIHRHDTAVLLIEGADEREAAENVARLRKAARRNGFRVLVAPRWCSAADDGPDAPHAAGGFIDLVEELRRHGVHQVILAGMSAHPGVESRLRELLELGFAVIVARDATTGPRPPDWGDGYMAAQIDFAFLAHAACSTDELVSAIGRSLAAA